jgi:hypothetical protein
LGTVTEYLLLFKDRGDVPKTHQAYDLSDLIIGL